MDLSQLEKRGKVVGVLAATDTLRAGGVKDGRRGRG
jgi:hypothetical protein